MLLLTDERGELGGCTATDADMTGDFALTAVGITAATQNTLEPHVLHIEK